VTDRESETQNQIDQLEYRIELINDEMISVNAVIETVCFDNTHEISSLQSKFDQHSRQLEQVKQKETRVKKRWKIFRNQWFRIAIISISLATILSEAFDLVRANS